MLVRASYTFLLLTLHEIFLELSNQWDEMARNNSNPGVMNNAYTEQVIVA
jgi:hypothetical protein